jgi:bacterial leucyl aminopeptidase
MRCAYLVAAFAAVALALPESNNMEDEKFTIELEGGERREVTVKEKFELKCVSCLGVIPIRRHYIVNIN